VLLFASVPSGSLITLQLKTCSYTKNSFARPELLSFTQTAHLVSVWVWVLRMLYEWIQLLAFRIAFAFAFASNFTWAEWLGNDNEANAAETKMKTLSFAFRVCSLHHLHIRTSVHPLTPCHNVYSYSYNLFRQQEVAGPGQAKPSQDGTGQDRPKWKSFAR